jgi:uncharacterized protein
MQTISKSARQHNHYSRDQFFEFNTQEGSIRDWNGQRNLLVSEDFIIALQRGLEQEAGPASGLLMYTLGQQWGTHDYQDFRQWFEAEFQTQFEKTNLKFLLETWWWPFTAQGWGKWELEQPAKGYLIVNLYDSAVAKTLGNVGRPVCHLYAGLFAGFFSTLFGKPLSGTEIQCYGMGESYCRFLIGSQDSINAVEFWLGNGATAQQIANKVKKGSAK